MVLRISIRIACKSTCGTRGIVYITIFVLIATFQGLCGGNSIIDLTAGSLVKYSVLGDSPLNVTEHLSLCQNLYHFPGNLVR